MYLPAVPRLAVRRSALLAAALLAVALMPYLMDTVWAAGVAATLLIPSFVPGLHRPFLHDHTSPIFVVCWGDATHTTATLTLLIGGSESNRQSHFSPPSLPIQS